MICSSLYLLVLISIILRVDGLLGKMTGTGIGGRSTSDVLSAQLLQEHCNAAVKNEAAASAHSRAT